MKEDERQRAGESRKKFSTKGGEREDEKGWVNGVCYTRAREQEQEDV